MNEAFLLGSLKTANLILSEVFGFKCEMYAGVEPLNISEAGVCLMCLLQWSSSTLLERFSKMNEINLPNAFFGRSLRLGLWTIEQINCDMQEKTSFDLNVVVSIYDHNKSSHDEFWLHHPNLIALFSSFRFSP